jgi:hypothetical protein
MIRSYASEVGKDLFEGNWAALAKKRPLEPLDDCFIDLLILDAAATESDIKKAFEGRLTGPIGDRRNSRPYNIEEPSSCSVGYRIEFVWTGTGVEEVNVTFAPSANERLRAT